MSTTRSFQAMLNEYLAIDLLKGELKQQDYLLSKVDMDEGAKGGAVIVPFEGQYASSVEFGALADDTDISQYAYVRGSLSPNVEAWGSLVFNHRDLMQNDGKINEKSFLKILPGQITDFVKAMKCAISVNALNGSHFATFTVNGTAGGVIEVDRVERFTLSQKLVIDDGNSSPLTVYVIAIDVNGGTLGAGAVTVSATRGGAAADVSAYTVAQGAKCYHPGAQASSYTSIKSQLLSFANGGPATVFGQTKLSYPYLQATQLDGSAVSATNILGTIFSGAARMQQLGRNMMDMEVVMSLKHMGSILALLEIGGGTNPGSPYKGAFNVVPGSRKVSAYGWTEITVGSPAGHTLKLVGILDMDNDWIWFNGGWDTVTMYSNGGLQRRKAPDGKEFYEKRATSGFVYILDHVLEADMAIKALFKHGIMHSIPNY